MNTRDEGVDPQSWTPEHVLRCAEQYDCRRIAVAIGILAGVELLRVLARPAFRENDVDDLGH